MHKNLVLFIIDGFCYDLEKNIICSIYQVAKRTNLFTGLVWSVLILSLNLLLTCQSWLQYWDLSLGCDTNRIWYNSCTLYFYSIIVNYIAKRVFLSRYSLRSHIVVSQFSTSISILQYGCALYSLNWNLIGNVNMVVHFIHWIGT